MVETISLLIRSRSKHTGFTLFELLIVIAIIGIIIAVASVSYASIQRQSRDSRRRSDILAVQNALEQYYADNGQYPGGTYPDDITSTTTYLPAGAPTDPKSESDYVASTYTTTNYVICADLEEDGVFGESESNYSDDACVQSLQ